MAVTNTAQYMYTIFSLLLVLSFLVLSESVPSNTLTTKWIRRPDYDNRVFHDHLLWTFFTKSRLGCAERCGRDSRCHFFTTTTNKPPNLLLCHGHSQPLTSFTNVMEISQANTTLYIVKESNGLVLSKTAYYLGSDWLTKTCSADSECGPATYRSCFANRCLCLPGWYFSQGQDSCQSACADLRAEYVEYPGWYVSSNNIAEATKTLQQCQQWCAGLSNCVTVEFKFDTSKCYLSSVTAREKSAYWMKASTNLSYWQRTCA